jgi:Transposase DDE domain
VEHLREVIHSQEIISQYRKEKQFFTRERALTFSTVVMVMIRGHKFAMQGGLNKVFKEQERADETPTPAALCEARQKIKPGVFAYLNEILCADYFRLGGTGDGDKRWHGRRVLGYDGTLLNLPDTPELGQAFSRQCNQHTTYVQGQAVVLYDVLNDIGLAGQLGPIGREQDPLMHELWQVTQVGDVLVMDRNFVDYSLIAQAIHGQRDVIIRCPHRGFSEVLAFWDSPDTERLVTLCVPRSAQAYVQEHELPESIQVRLIKFQLPSGETEVLLTTLCDVAQFPAEEFYTVYGWRWLEETYFGRFKNILEVERFGSSKEALIQHNFAALIFIATLDSILVRKPQAVLRARDEARHTQTRAKVNRVVSYVALIDHVVSLLSDTHSNTAEVLRELQAAFMRNPTRHRPGRHSPRLKLKHSRKLRYQQYHKRVVA